MRTATRLAVAVCLLGGFCVAPWAFGNGGPFVVKSPNGDPAAKGVLARIDPTLKPAQETRLRVLKEDLTIRFVPEPMKWHRDNFRLPPVAEVTAAYQIANPTDKEVQIDFGFPILRGIYLRYGMIPYPDVGVRIDKERVYPTVISNSAIYGMIRRNARQAIEKGIAADPELARLAAAVRSAWLPPKGSQKVGNIINDDVDLPLTQSPLVWVKNTKPSADYLPARENLRAYLTDRAGWNARDAALMAEYLSVDFGRQRRRPNSTRRLSSEVRKAWRYTQSRPADAIGEQKATQLFAQLASRFDKDAGAAYEAIFAAWGGNVRERSIDMATGRIRPRELKLPPEPPYDLRKSEDEQAPEYYDQRLTADPTVYARVEYLDPKAKITKYERESCQAVLKYLPVVFTFAPMNLLHYQAKFPAPSRPHGDGDLPAIRLCRHPRRRQLPDCLRAPSGHALEGVRADQPHAARAQGNRLQGLGRDLAGRRSRGQGGPRAEGEGERGRGHHAAGCGKSLSRDRSIGPRWRSPKRRAANCSSASTKRRGTGRSRRPSRNPPRHSRRSSRRSRRPRSTKNLPGPCSGSPVSRAGPADRFRRTDFLIRAPKIRRMGRSLAKTVTIRKSVLRVIGRAIVARLANHEP